MDRYLVPMNTTWYIKPHLLKLNFSIFSLILYSSASGYDASLMNSLQALPQWQRFMHNPAGLWLGFINAIYWIGAGITYSLAASVSNKYGRKAAIYAGYGCFVPGVALLGASHVAAFVLSRLLVGGSFGFFGTAVPVLINEIAHPAHRGIASAMYMSGWYVGGTLAACVALGARLQSGDWAWRLPAVLQCLLPAAAFPGFLICPESPRWLVAAGRKAVAREVLQQTHAGGHVGSELVEVQLQEIMDTIQAGQAHEQCGYLDMIRSKANRHRLFISATLGLFSQWSGNGVVSYYLPMVLASAGVTDVGSQLVIAACLQIWNLVFAVGAALSVDRLGRRTLFLASVATMLVSYIVITVLSGAFASNGAPAVGIAVVPFLFLFFAGYDIALTPLLTAYPCEIWPYALRSRGLTVTGISSVLAICFNTLVNPIALDSIGWRYYICFIVILILYGLTVLVYYPETRGYSLERTAAVFESADDRKPSG